MSAKDALPKVKSYDWSNSTRTAAPRARALSVGSQPLRCSSAAKLSRASEGRRFVRLQSESSCSLQTLKTLRNGSFQELCCSSGRVEEELKLPIMPQRVKTDDLMEMAAGSTSTVLPDVSRRQDDVKFRATHLRQQHVEKLNSKFDSLKSKSQNLAEWLQNQP